MRWLVKPLLVLVGLIVAGAAAIVLVAGIGGGFTPTYPNQRGSGRLPTENAAAGLFWQIRY